MTKAQIEKTVEYVLNMHIRTTLFQSLLDFKEDPTVDFDVVESIAACAAGESVRKLQELGLIKLSGDSSNKNEKQK